MAGNDPMEDIFGDEIFPGEKKDIGGTPTWAKKKSIMMQKKEEKEIGYKKERNLLVEDADLEEDTGYAPPPPRYTEDKDARFEDEPSKSQLLKKVFSPMATALAHGGFFPYYVVEDEDSYYQVVFNRKSYRSIVFHVAFILYAIVCAMVLLGFIMVYNDLAPIINSKPYFTNATDSLQQPRYLRWEHIMISNYWVMLVVVGFWMTMGLVGSLHTLYYAEDYGHFHSYWHKTLTMLDIDPTDYVMKFLKKEMYMYIIMITLFLIAFCVAASFRICCSLIGVFFLGWFMNDLPSKSWFVLVQFIGFIIVMYGYTGTRAFILQFVFYCRLVTNTAKIWNYRFESVLVGALFRDTLTPKMFAQYRIILKDHFLVVQLFKLTEGCFGSLLQIYYLMQTTCLVLMSLYLYFNMAARQIGVTNYLNQSFQRFDFYMPTYIPKEETADQRGEQNYQSVQRALHTVFYIFLFFQSMMSSFRVTAWGQIALDEGMDGFNVLRKHGLIMCTNKSERNLIHSLTISFARNNPLAITADGYFTVDKQLFLCIIAVIVNYVTMLIQFHFDEYIVSSVDFRLNIGPPTGNKTVLKSLPE